MAYGSRRKKFRYNDIIRKLIGRKTRNPLRTKRFKKRVRKTVLNLAELKRHVNPIATTAVNTNSQIQYYVRELMPTLITPGTTAFHMLGSNIQHRKTVC